jgi:hypothetical protein
MPIAESEGVADLVSETPQRIPYLEALGLLRKADTILLIGSDEPHYTASKIFPALLAGRPCLALFHRASSAHESLKRHEQVRVLGFDTTVDLDSLATALTEILEQAPCRRPRRDQRPPEAASSWDAQVVAASFAGIFDDLSARSLGGAGGDA